MRIYVNEKYIARRAKLGRRTSLLGLAILAVGMLSSFSPGVIANWMAEGNPMAETPLAQWLVTGGWLMVAMMALLLGFFLGQMGNFNMRRFIRSPRPDQVVARALKGFDDRNHFYAWSTPGDLVLAGPAGVFVFITRDVHGAVTVANDRVRQPFTLRRLIAFGQESVGLPIAEAQDAADKLARWLNQDNAEEENAVEVSPIVVFTNDRVQLEVESATVPVLHQKQLKQHLRGQLRGSRLGKNALQAALDRLNAEAIRRGAEEVE